MVTNRFALLCDQALTASTSTKGIGFYETVQLINFIRKKVANNTSPFDSTKSFQTRYDE